MFGQFLLFTYEIEVETCCGVSSLNVVHHDTTLQPKMKRPQPNNGLFSWILTGYNQLHAMLDSMGQLVATKFPTK